MLRRLPIGPKLIGLVSVLLLLMLSVAAYSFMRSQGLRERVEGLSAELIPLVRVLGLVHDDAMQQSLQTERALRHLHEPDVIDEPALRAEVAGLIALGDRVHEGLRDAKRQARDSSERAGSRQDVQKLADMQAELRVLQRDHLQLTEHLHEHFEAEIERRAGGGSGEGHAAGALRERRLATSQARFERDLSALIADLEAFTEGRAEGVRRREENLFELTVENLILTVIAFFVGVIVATIITRRIVGPIRSLVAGAHKVTEGDLNVSVEVTTQDEVGELTTAFNRMVSELRARERVKETFGKYLDPRIVENVIDEVGADSMSGGDRRVMSVFFMDLARFSGIAEKLSPADLVRVINRYFTIATDPIAARKGVVDKLIGDEVMAWWGPPFCEESEHAELACRAALDQLEALKRFRAELPGLLDDAELAAAVDVRIGISSGELIVGSIGSERSRSYTVMGDTVNLASRLEGVNKQYGTRILVSAKTREMLDERFLTREIDCVRVVGREDASPIHELLALSEGAPLDLEALRKRYALGLAAYREQRWDEALEAFEACLVIRPGDGPSRTFIERITTLRESPPGEGWDGVWRLVSK